MKWGPLAFLVLSLLIKSHALSNKNNRTETFKVFRVYPQSWQHIETLAEIRKISEEENEIDFWLDSRQPGQFADIMVAPRAQSYFMDLLMKHDLQFKTTIDDVEKMIYENEHHIKNDDKPHVLDENYENLMHYENFRFRKRLKDEPSKFGDRPFEKVGQARANYPFGQYTDYATMVRYMRTIEFYYPHIAKLIRIGTSHEGQPIEGLKLGYHVSNTSKPGFWIDGNIHAREWASSHTALFIINQLVSGYGKDPVVTYYMNKMNFFIIPCLNPDGYEYSRSSAWPEIRLWRKNRSPERCAPSRWGGIRCCSGVDLNRNFDFHWSESGANHHPCSNEYVGESPFSEPESRAVNDFLTSQEMTHKLNAFITLHTYAQLWIHPFSHEVEYYPNDITRLLNVAEKAVSRLRDVYGTQYRVGTGADLLYPAAGGSDDWAKEKLGAKYVYLIELRPQLEQSNGFILKQEELIPTAIESFEGIKVVIEAVLEDNGIPISKLLKASNRHENTHPRVHAVPNYNEEQEEKFHDGRFGNFDSFQNVPPINFSPNQQDSSNNSVFITKVNLSVIPNLPATSTAAPSPNPTYTTPEQTNYYKQTASSTPSSSSQPSSSSTTTSHPSTSTVTITNPTTTISTTSSSTPSTTSSTTHSTTTSPPTSSSTTKQTLNPTVTTTSETTTSTQAPNSSSTSTTPSSTTASTVSEKDNTTIVAISTTTTSSMPSTPLYEVNMAMAITPIDIQSTIYSDEPINSTESNIITTPTLGQVTEITLETSRAKLYNELLLRKQLLRWRSLNLISPHITSTLKTTATDPIAYREEMAIDTTKPAGVNSAPRFLTSIPVQADRENLWPSLRIRNTLPPVVQLPPLVVGGLKKAVSENPLRYVPTTACEDKKYSCTFWIKADRNVCVDQARFMKLNCPFSCNFCTRS